MQGTGAAQGPLGLLPPQPGLPSSPGYDKKGRPHRLGRKGQSTLRKPGPSLAWSDVRDWLTPSTTLGFRLLFLFSWRFRLHFFPFGFFSFTFSHSEVFIVFTPTKIRAILRVFTWNRSHLCSPLLEDAGLLGSSVTFCTHIPVPSVSCRLQGPNKAQCLGVRPGPSLTRPWPQTGPWRHCACFPCMRWGGPYCLHHGALVQTELIQVRNTLPRWCSALPMVSLVSEGTEHVAAQLLVGSVAAWLESRRKDAHQPLADGLCRNQLCHHDLKLSLSVILPTLTQF